MGPDRPGRPRVLIAGGGLAGLEAALALRDLAGDRIEVELCSPCGQFVYRPFAVGEPVDAAPTVRHDLDALAARIGAAFRLGGVVSVDAEARRATARDGDRIPFDYLIVATGARLLRAVPGAVTFWGAVDEGGVGRLVRRLRAGILRDVVFTMPAGGSWAVPIYELALLGSAVLSRSGVEDARLTVVTPEEAPLRLFGESVGRRMARLMSDREIGIRTGTHPVEFDGERLRVSPGEPIETGAVVSLPRLEGRHLDGLPADGDGFIRVDEHCRVIGTEGIFAAGDVTTFAVKQVGMATQEADAAAEAIAAAAGLAVEPASFDPVAAPRWVERDGRIAGRYLTPFMAGLRKVA